MLLGREPHLGVHNPIRGQVECALLRHPVQRAGGLHDPDRVRDRRQISLERSRIGRGREPPAEFIRVVGWQRTSDLGRKLHDLLRAQATIEVVVE